MNKPKFDPNAKFEVASETEAKPKFDPNASFDVLDGSSSVKTQGPKETFLDKASNVMSLGYLPQIETVLEGALPGTGKPFKQAIPGTNEYIKRRDELSGLLKKEGEDNPVASAAGTGAGIVGSLATLPVSGAAKAATIGGKALNALKGTGAAAGLMLASNPGETEGEVSPLQLGKRIDDFKDSASTPIGAAGLALPSVVGAAGIAKELPLISKGLDKIGSVAAKAGEFATGVPKKIIETYAKYSDEIKQMAKESDNNAFQAANTLRDKFSTAIDKTKKEINTNISKALEGSKNTIDSAPIIKALEDSKSSINAKLNPEQIGHIDDMIKKISSLSDDGVLGVKDAHDVKKFLQDRASSAYKSPGQINSLGNESASAARAGAAKARELVNQAEPVIAESNNKLAWLHDIEDDLNKNLIGSGRPEAGLMSAGSGSNPKNVESLRDLGRFTNTDMLGDAEKLSTMRTMGDAQWTPMDTTGKSALRAGAMSVPGLLAAGPLGGAITATLSSPMVLKTAIDSGKLTSKMLTDPNVQSILGRGLLVEAKEMLDKKKAGLLNVRK